LLAEIHSVGSYEGLWYIASRDSFRRELRGIDMWQGLTFRREITRD
jgi:hypothetical protein